MEPAMLKKIAYYLIGCIIIGVIISAVFSSLPVYKFIAEGFLVSLSKGEYPQAYAMMSKDFQTRFDLPAFISNVDKSGLKNYERAVWTSEVTASDNKHGTLVGTVHTKQNTQIFIEFNYVLVDGQAMSDKGWRIDNIIIKNPTNPESQPETPKVAPAN